MALSALDPTFLALRGYISCIREKLQKKPPSGGGGGLSRDVKNCSRVSTFCDGVGTRYAAADYVVR